VQRIYTKTKKTNVEN